ncbi:hypothetical protein ANO14919_092480 [Xylariales sp. No.14919]|nr:hypothetical protein ANO14919_092480 [Xylariales sp. No.14919]
MGSFVFKWNHPATEVYVTGTFDEWKKTEKLEKIGDSFEKQVALPDTSSKIFYKVRWFISIVSASPSPEFSFSLAICLYTLNAMSIALTAIRVHIPP